MDKEKIKERKRKYMQEWRIKNREHYIESKTNWYNNNREKVRKTQQEYAKNNADTLRNIEYRNNYGITIEDYSEMFRVQGAKCAICKAEEPGRGRKHFCVDHSKKTGVVRRLLCFNCNNMLGMAKENPVILRAAAIYIEKHQLLSEVTNDNFGWSEALIMGG